MKKKGKAKGKKGFGKKNQHGHQNAFAPLVTKKMGGGANK